MARSIAAMRNAPGNCKHASRKSRRRCRRQWRVGKNWKSARAKVCGPLIRSSVSAPASGISCYVKSKCCGFALVPALVMQYLQSTPSGFQPLATLFSQMRSKVSAWDCQRFLHSISRKELRGFAQSEGRCMFFFQICHSLSFAARQASSRLSAKCCSIGCLILLNSLSISDGLYPATIAKMNIANRTAKNKNVRIFSP